MTPRRGFSIRSRVLLFLALTILLASAGAGFYQYASFLRSIDEDIEQQLKAGVGLMQAVLSPADHGKVTPESVQDPAWQEKQAKLNTLHAMVGTSYLYSMFRSDGKILFDYYDDPENEYVEEPLAGQPYDDYPDELVEAFETGTLIVTDFYTDQFGTFRSVFKPITNAEGTLVAVYAADLDVTDIQSKRNQALTVFLVFLLVEIVALVVFSVILGRLIFRPLRRLTALSLDLAEGDGDLTTKLDFKAVGEIRQLSNHFNRFLAKLSQVMNHLKQASALSHQVSQDLAASSEEASAASIEISGNMDSINTRSHRLNDEVSRSREALAAISEGLEGVVGRLEGFSRSTDATARLLEGQLKAIAATQHLTQQNLSSAQHLGRLATQGEVAMKNTTGALDAMVNTASGIFAVLNTVSDISDQTNLLAMNASIEAAHAGSQGRGFAVVAGEIRKLAELTRRIARDINASLSHLTTTMEQTTGLSQRSAASFQALVTGILQASEGMQQIAKKMDHAQQSGLVISDAVAELQALGSEVGEASALIQEKASAIRDAVESVATLSEATRESIGEMAAGLTEIRTANLAVADLATRNTAAVAILDENLAQFKTEQES